VKVESKWVKAKICFSKVATAILGLPHDLLTWLWLIAARLSIGSNPVANISALKPWEARNILRKLIVRGHGQICMVDYQEHERQSKQKRK